MKPIWVSGDSGTCSECRFFAPLPINGCEYPDGCGRCQRMPPVPVPEYNHGVFPIMSGTDWCGEWRRKFEDPPADAD